MLELTVYDVRIAASRMAAVCHCSEMLACTGTMLHITLMAPTAH
jgi:hypothetical protein